HGVNGSFNLTNLLLYDENGTLIDNRYYAYTTSAYNYTDFQPLIQLTGNYSDYGTDTNGNGLFDNLTVDVEVILASEGNCVINARLMDTSGEEIVWTSNTSWLYADQPQTIQLNFDGRYIYGNMMDGPYYVRDVYVYHTGDPTQPDYVHDAYTTAAYNYTNFERSGIIAGTVKYSIGVPISNASVYVSGVDSDYTDTAGNYSLTILQNGTYNVTAEPPIGVNLSSNSTIVNVTVGEITFVDFILCGAPEQYFDTGLGTYPSIFGTHNGTIKPSHDVFAQKMYTYPCAGTGGHSEYVRIWNESEILAEENWKGYKGDWYNITFSKPFILLADGIYNYTIRTGSYPQIHHNRTLTVPDGEITCSEFIDANGRRYDDWIPAIKLEGGACIV
ncbi:MAG: carboxypeptidase regulatory-like domain-containing protein, partial [Candidatus Syntrophoarchaeum sp.]|nr:carboxypeptidase regulatory-like domain-containing protein [Candidatus Syntrophoarchaeum sp.]